MKRVLAAAAVALLGATAIAPARGQEVQPPVPLRPDNPASAALWANPDVRPEEGDRARVDVTQAPTSIRAHDPLEVTLKVTNTSDQPLKNLTVTPRRGPATGSVTDQRVATIASPEQYPVVGDIQTLSITLAPGTSTTINMNITEDNLAFPGLDTYPVMFVLRDDTGAVLDTDRFHLATRGTPDDTRPAGMTALFPISAPVDIVPGETGTAPDSAPLILSSDALAEELAPQGRLSTLIDVFDTATKNPDVAHATCLALDPSLLDTVARMTAGYTVSAERPDIVEPPQRLRDSWGDQQDKTVREPGRGADNARAWLAKVTELASNHCVVALPWDNADLNAVARTGDVWLMREAIERGPAVLSRILGTSGVTNTVIPGGGYITPGVAETLGWADHSRSTVPTNGMQQAWERSHQTADSTTQHSGPAGDDSTSALDRSDIPTLADAAAPQPEQPVRVLVAANTIKHPGESRFSWAAPGVMAVQYQSSLTAVLATVGPEPATAGYSNTDLRFDYRQDSTTARAVNAAAAVHLAAQEKLLPADSDEESDPILINPPASWDADSALDIMESLQEVMETRLAQPLTLEDYLAVPPDTTVDRAEDIGTPFADPTVFSDTEILTTSQQAGFIDELSSLLVPDPAIALTRYGFTLPLRRDLLRALSIDARRSIASFSTAQEQASRRLAGSRDTLNELRAAVALIPPGNVYTRTSPASPLPIVARNGLPLPVDATIRYVGPKAARLNVPPRLRIPADGSITTTMTADLPESPAKTELQLFLATPSGAQISQPVDIEVRTSGAALRGWVILSALAVFLALMLLYTFGIRHRARRTTDPIQHH